MRFTLDGSSTPTLVHIPQTVPPTYNVRLWKSPTLPFARHDLQILHDTTPGSGSYVVLDAFMIGGYSMGYSTTTTSPKTDSTSGISNTTLKILSIVFGVAFGVTLVLCAILFFRMRRTTRRQPSSIDSHVERTLAYETPHQGEP